MPHSTNKELILGIMVGTAGISLLVLWYQKVRKPRTAMNLPEFFSLGNMFDSTALQEETHNGQGTTAIFQRRQLQILEKLNELLTNMEELKEEIRFLKETIPKLEEYIQDELGGKLAVHRISPQHRARRRRATTVQSSAKSNSSEEAESEGGCCREDKSFQSNYFEDQVASDPQHHGVSSISQSNTSLGLKTSRPSATHTISSPKGSGKVSSPSSPSASSYFSGKNQCVFSRLQKNKFFLCWCQSRANFDSQEDTSISDLKSCSDYFGAFRSRRCFSSCKLSIVACNRSATFFESQLNNQGTFNLKEIEIFSKSPTFIPPMNEPTSGIAEEESFAVLSRDEDKPSPTEIPKIRYITANTDTEEQSFSVPKAFNVHIEELKLDSLLQKADHLRMTESGKMESFELLCDHKEKFRDEIEFLWRFARAYGDMFELSKTTQEKKHYANIGKTLGEKAITRAPMNGHCHMWYAVLCGYVSEFEGLQNKINYGHRFKEHLDIAIQLLPEEPFLYYLNGRYCYTVSKLSWIEKKMAATLFGKTPSSTVQEALHNFLKAEEIHPGYSLLNYMYLAKCYVDLEENQNAWKFCNLALLLPTVTKEDKEAQTEVKAIIKSLKR